MIEVRDAPHCGGKGVFAKYDLPKNVIVCDYRGVYIKNSELEGYIEKVANKSGEAAAEKVRNYSFQYAPGRNSYTVLSHFNIDKYIGRLFNHSVLHPNIVARPALLTIGRLNFKMILYITKKAVVKGDELFVNYKGFHDLWWHMSCWCPKCNGLCTCRGCRGFQKHPKPALPADEIVPVGYSDEVLQSFSASQYTQQNKPVASYMEFWMSRRRFYYGETSRLGCLCAADGVTKALMATGAGNFGVDNITELLIEASGTPKKPFSPLQQCTNF